MSSILTELVWPENIVSISYGIQRLSMVPINIILTNCLYYLNKYSNIVYLSMTDPFLLCFIASCSFILERKKENAPTCYWELFPHRHKQFSKAATDFLSLCFMEIKSAQSVGSFLSLLRKRTINKKETRGFQWPRSCSNWSRVWLCTLHPCFKRQAKKASPIKSQDLLYKS